MADRAFPDQNLTKSLIAVSTTDGTTPVSLRADPVSHALLTASSSGGQVGIDPVGQVGVAYDSIVYANTSSTVDTYVYKAGGIAGTVTATVTITYTDTTKAQVSTVVRT